MYLIDGVSHYELQAARFLLEFAAREAEAKEAAKVVDFAAARDRKKLRQARRTVSKVVRSD